MNDNGGDEWGLRWDSSCSGDRPVILQWCCCAVESRAVAEVWRVVGSSMAAFSMSAMVGVVGLVMVMLEGTRDGDNEVHRFRSEEEDGGL